MPILSSNAQVIKDDFYKDSNPEIHTVDMQSPPDPDSARRRVSPTLTSSPGAFVHADDFQTNSGVSPPPEEPKPSRDYGVIYGGNDCLPKACLWEIRKPTVPRVTRPQVIPKSNDESGVTEMLRLLNKFQRLRDEQRSEQIRVAQMPEMTTSRHSQSREADNCFIIALACGGSCHTSLTGMKRLICEDDDENNDECGGTPSLTCSRSEEPRKSLSAQYIEEKLKASTVVYGKQEAIVSSTSTLPNPNVDLCPESTKPFSPESTELISSNNKEGENTHTNEFDLLDLEKHIIAGDGNPISRSLLSLVMEEDIPDFMEAVNENVTSIRFEETEPKVYTYLDEMSAKVNKEWVEGVHVDYETYQNIIAAEVEEYKKNIAELQKWRESIAAQMPQDTSTHEDREFSVDVPSSLTYSPTHNENKTMCVRIVSSFLKYSSSLP
ncbi:unnamed protein product [Angiostrongylus costaricensis]|uniref:Uncharacterized protein n=1 Tax=Angiostrongylus costaricensis TaxID=334426 RepID=A0A158PFM9_ANGCS|nr:unnamed protein product [Angiostrongylus costaricensis]